MFMKFKKSDGFRDIIINLDHVEYFIALSDFETNVVMNNGNEFKVIGPMKVVDEAVEAECFLEDDWCKFFEIEKTLKRVAYRSTNVKQKKNMLKLLSESADCIRNEELKSHAIQRIEIAEITQGMKEQANV